MDLQGQVAIVTGAASGLGRATAEALVAEGAVVAMLDLDEAALGPRRPRSAAMPSRSTSPMPPRPRRRCPRSRRWDRCGCW